MAEEAGAGEVVGGWVAAFSASALGAAIRYFIAVLSTYTQNDAFPSEHAIILGCAVMGVLSVVRSSISNWLAFVLGTGFAGCCTTFSSWKLEAGAMLFGQPVAVLAIEPDTPTEQALSWLSLLTSGVFVSLGAFAAGRVLALALIDALKPTAPLPATLSGNRAPMDDAKVAQLLGRTAADATRDAHETSATALVNSQAEVSDGTRHEAEPTKPTPQSDKSALPSHRRSTAGSTAPAMLSLAPSAGASAASDSIRPSHLGAVSAAFSVPVVAIALACLLVESTQHVGVIWIMIFALPGMLVRHWLCTRIRPKSLKFFHFNGTLVANLLGTLLLAALGIVRDHESLFDTSSFARSGSAVLLQQSPPWSTMPSNSWTRAQAWH